MGAARTSARGWPRSPAGRESISILDAVGGPSFARFLGMLAPFGMLISYGRLQGSMPPDVVEGLEKGAGYLNSGAVRVFTMHTLDDKPGATRAIDERSDRASSPKEKSGR